MNVDRMSERMNGSLKALHEVQAVLDERSLSLEVLQRKLVESERKNETLRNAMILRDSTLNDMEEELQAVRDGGMSPCLDDRLRRSFPVRSHVSIFGGLPLLDVYCSQSTGVRRSKSIRSAVGKTN